MKKVYACGIVTLIFFVETLLLIIQFKNAELDYTEVSVEVVSSETKETTVRRGFTRSTATTYDIVVRYKGQNYELENAHNSYSYRVGATVTAYLSGGKMYANVEGVRTATPAAYAYFTALFASFIMIFVTAGIWSGVSQKKRRESQQ